MIIVSVAALVGGRVALVRARRSRADRRRDEAVPDLVDLVALAAAAGHPAWTCVRVVAERTPAPLRPAMAAAVHEVDHGVPLAVALARLGDALGPEGRALTEALAVGAVSGAPLTDALERVVEAARAARRRRAQERARRLPVLLLVPMVGCILPAFVLLAVVPLVLAAVSSIDP